jgi:protease I
MPDIKGRKIAVLATDGFEQVELTEPVKALREAGAKVDVIAPQAGKIQGMNHHDKGDQIPVDVVLKDAKPGDYDALILPGGVTNPDTLRTEEAAVNFVKAFVTADKPIGAICHGPWTLINAGGVKGKQMTSWPSLQQDLINAGATWSDQPVVKDHKLVTSRKPDDLAQFNQAVIEMIAAA